MFKGNCPGGGNDGGDGICGSDRYTRTSYVHISAVVWTDLLNVYITHGVDVRLSRRVAVGDGHHTCHVLIRVMLVHFHLNASNSFVIVAQLRTNYSQPTSAMALPALAKCNHFRATLNESLGVSHHPTNLSIGIIGDLE